MVAQSLPAVERIVGTLFNSWLFALGLGRCAHKLLFDIICAHVGVGLFEYLRQHVVANRFDVLLNDLVAVYVEGDFTAV